MIEHLISLALPVLLPLLIAPLKTQIEKLITKIPNRAMPWISAFLGAASQVALTGTVDTVVLTQGVTAGLAAVGFHQGTVFKEKNQPAKGLTD